VYNLRAVVRQVIIGARRIASANREPDFPPRGKRTRVVESLPALMDTLSSIDELSFPVALGQEVISDSTSDHALLEATRTGDGDAFAELMSRYRNQITSYIYRMTNDYDGAVDLAQETFVRLYRAADRYQSSYAFSTYIYRIATNLAISELRKRKRRRLVSLTGFFQSKDGSEASELDPIDEHPLQDLEMVATERRLAVQRAIGTLPEKYRAPLILRDVEGRSYEEISRILQTSEGTVKSRISRARDFLREKMRAYQ
jgi:RNA polymerase sigma-70 factor, ECF subfamily